MISAAPFLMYEMKRPSSGVRPSLYRTGRGTSKYGGVLLIAARFNQFPSHCGSSQPSSLI